METPTRGEVIIDGRNLSRMREGQVPHHRRKVGVVFQNHQLLFDRTVFDNVALPLLIAGTSPRETGRRVRAALDKVGLLGKEKLNPIQLSGGEQQRVGIARAVVNKPPILLADEPTGNLDPELSAEIMNLFCQFQQVGVTVLIATHDIDLVERMGNRRLILQQGQMVAGNQASDELSATRVSLMSATQQRPNSQRPGPQRKTQNSQGASEAKVAGTQVLGAWYRNHQMVAVESLAKLLAAPASSLMTWLVIAIALTLPGALFMAVDNLQQLSGHFETSGRMTVFLEQGIDEEQANAMQQQLSVLHSVSNADYVSAEEALEEFKEYSGLADALTYLDENPLPAVILVEPPLGLSKQELEGLVDKIQSFPAGRKCSGGYGLGRATVSFISLGSAFSAGGWRSISTGDRAGGRQYHSSGHRRPY